MDADFIIKYDTMYDERAYRAPSETDEDTEEELNEYGQPKVVCPWEMEW